MYTNVAGKLGTLVSMGKWIFRTVFAVLVVGGLYWFVTSASSSEIPQLGHTIELPPVPVIAPTPEPTPTQAPAEPVDEDPDDPDPSASQGAEPAPPPPAVDIDDDTDDDGADDVDD